MVKGHATNKQWSLNSLPKKPPGSLVNLSSPGQSVQTEDNFCTSKTILAHGNSHRTICYRHGNGGCAHTYCYKHL